MRERVIWHFVESNFRSPNGVYFNRNLSYVIRVPKFIEIEKNNPRSIHNFVNELEELNIYGKLKRSVNSDPEENLILC